MFNISDNLKELPDKPGVYMHKDEEGQIIYIGKAISLKNRIRQYFQSKSNLDPKVRAMVSHIKEFEYIITETEMEALLLESNLIKKYMPKYNVLLRDDKSFPYIKVTINEKWPRLVKTRRIIEDGSVYFGPYTDVSSMDRLIELLTEIYSIKRCSTVNFPKDFKPCLNFHIEKCQGICKGDVDNSEYRKSVDQAVDFLFGNTKGILAQLKDRMAEAAGNMDYEKAAEYRDQIIAVEAIPDQERLDDFLAAVRRNKVKVIRRRAEESKKQERERIKAIDDGWKVVGLAGSRRIEAYDISHIAGTDAVGAMVVFENCKKLKKSYRRFRIKTAPGGGDTDSLKEVIYRRLKRALDGSQGFLPLPDLMLIDGGINQVNAALEVVNALKLRIPIAGMVKNERHKTKGLIYDGQEKDLKNNRPLLRYISLIQDEVHRFAIDYHRGLRSKKLKKSVLDDIPGIGEKRKAALLKSLGNIENIRRADIETLRKVEGMNLPAAKNVKEHLNKLIVKNQ